MLNLKDNYSFEFYKAQHDILKRLISDDNTDILELIDELEVILKRCDTPFRINNSKAVSDLKRLAFERFKFLLSDIPGIPFPEKLPNGENWPKISIVTPSYQQGEYIQETIESVIRQGYPNLEYIIIDGGSTDQTLEIVRSYGNQIHKFISEKDSGQSEAINKGFALATGEIYTWLNSDDQLLPGALFSIALAFHLTGADIVSGICESYSDKGLIERHLTSCRDGVLPLSDLLDLDRGWNIGQFFYQPEVFFKSEIWRKSGSAVKESLYYSMDYELWCRFALNKAIMSVVPRSLIKFRVHENQKTNSTDGFKKELAVCRDEFIHQNKIDKSLLGLVDIPKDESLDNLKKQLNFLFINDFGFKYGAGIAHERIKLSLELAGHNVETIVLEGLINGGKVNDQEVLELARKFNPDFVIFGNVHGICPEFPDFIDQICREFQSFWVTHDFWILTGRCAYPGNCTQLKTGCDELCPTSDLYPVIPKNKISESWTKKQLLISSNHSPIILCNSRWAYEKFKSHYLSKELSLNKLQLIKLGVPQNIFYKINKSEARQYFGIPQDEFVVLFNSSSLFDKRKGGDKLLEALTNLDKNLVVLLIGNVDGVLTEGKKIKFVKTGYMTDNSILNYAYNAADILVAPSSEETYGQVFAEAAMVGLPSIAFANSGMKESMVGNIMGLHAHGENSDGLMNALSRLYKNRKKLDELSSLGYLFSSTFNTLEGTYRSFVEVLWNIGYMKVNYHLKKISFLENGSISDRSARKVAGWLPLDGFRGLEGPYEDMGIDFRFHWLQGLNIKVEVNVIKSDVNNVDIYCSNHINDNLELQVILNDNALSNNIKVPKCELGEIMKISVPLKLQQGKNILTLVPNKVFEGESELVFMLVDIVINHANI